MKRLVLFLLCACMVMIPLAACTSDTPATDTTAADTTTAAPTDPADTAAPPSEETTEAVTDPETPTEEEPAMPVEPLEIKDRYFIFRLWNFDILSLSEFKSTVDTVAADGFNAIKVHIPWHHAEKTAGVYDYAAFDAMIDYVVKEKGMKVAISLDMTRTTGDKVLTDADIMRDPAGNLCVGGSGAGNRMQISFNSATAVE